MRFRSKRPKAIPIRTPREIEEKVLAVRKATGFGPKPVSTLVNESLRREDRSKRVYPSLIIPFIALFHHPFKDPLEF